MLVSNNYHQEHSLFEQLLADVSKTVLPLLCTSSALGSSGGWSLAQLEENAAARGGRVLWDSNISPFSLI